MFRTLSWFAFTVYLTTATLLAAVPGGAPQLPPQPTVRPAGIPANAVMLSPCVRAMGEHWAALKDLPTGPIYGTWQGQPIFTEIMVSVDELDKGFSWTNIRALPGYRIDHTDFEFEPHGHPGFPVPHYDLHLYYISAGEQAQICPDGLPNPAMKPANQNRVP